MNAKPSRKASTLENDEIKQALIDLCLVIYDKLPPEEQKRMRRRVSRQSNAARRRAAA